MYLRFGGYVFSFMEEIKEELEKEQEEIFRKERLKKGRFSPMQTRTTVFLK